MTKEAAMAQDSITTRREENIREGAVGKSDVSDRPRAVGSVRDTAPRRWTGPQRSPMFGTTSSPFSLMRRMADDIERLFSDLDVARVGYGLTSPSRLGTGIEPWRSESRLTEATWAPPIETFRRDGKLVVRADLPGLTRDDITIETDDDVLTISGERTDEYKDNRDDYFRSERTYGRFFRAIQLPEGVDAEKIDATFKEGVLEVAIPEPKVTESRQRQIRIR
jgi:HSP20 family protein